MADQEKGRLNPYLTPVISDMSKPTWPASLVWALRSIFGLVSQTWKSKGSSSRWLVKVFCTQTGMWQCLVLCHRH